MTRTSWGSAWQSQRIHQAQQRGYGDQQQERERLDLAWARSVLTDTGYTAEDDQREGEQQTRAYLAQSAAKWTDAAVLHDLNENDGLTSALVLVWAERTAGERGTFEFVAELGGKLRRRQSLSVAQVRGLWNVLRAEETREQAAQNNAQPFPAAGEAEPPPRYAGISALMAELAERMDRPKIAVPSEQLGEVWLTIAGDRARFPGSVNVSSSKRYGGTFYGRIIEGAPSDQLPPHLSVCAALDELEQDPSIARAVELHGRAVGRCMNCGRELTAGESIARGIGPICAERLGVA